MSVICFSSLKGGVGKTSLSINVAHALAVRGCRTLIIDFDPSGHTTRFFFKGLEREKAIKEHAVTPEAPVVKFLLSEDEASNTERSPLLRRAVVGRDSLLLDVRQDMSLLPGGNELRHLLLGRGAKSFTKRFPILMHEFKFHFDHIVIDTPPDFSLLTRNALATADLVVVPVDSSEMSIHSLEELIQTARFLRRPTWAVLRTMVNKRAYRTQNLSQDRLSKNIAMHEPASVALKSTTNDPENFDIENPYEFMQMLQEWEKQNPQASKAAASDQTPIYLLRSLVYRTEQQNQLSFAGMTSFDTKMTAPLSEQYLAVARELESLISDDSDSGLDCSFSNDEEDAAEEETSAGANQL